MTEEEKKAIETINLFLNKPVRFKNKNIIANNEIEAIKTFLNLIEKLKKENEELKEKNFKRDKELIELEEYANKNFVRKDDVKAKYIPKDKIRKLEDMWNDNIWNATDEASEEKAEMIRDVYRGLLDE